MGWNALWKAKAREALQNHWLTGLLIALIVNLPSLLVQGIAAVTGNDLTVRLQEIIYGAVNQSGTAVDEAKFFAGLQEIVESQGLWVMQGLRVVAWLLTPCLTLGMVAWLLGRLRKEEDSGVMGVFSRIRLFWKGIGLRLYVTWRIVLAMLPGVGLSILCMLPLWLNDGSSRIAVLQAANTAVGLQSVASMVMAALGIMAAVRYALSDYVLADHQEMGPIRAAKESKRLTQGRRMQVFSLYISFLIWYLAEIMLYGLCESIAGPVVGLMVQMLCSLAIAVYLQESLGAFYLECTGEQKIEPVQWSQEEKP